MIRPLLLGAVGALLVGSAACSGGTSDGDAGPAAGCGEVVRERFDPDSAVHVLPGGDEPTYLSDPPTSGPHAPTSPVGGVREEPLARSEQVGLLEAGIVIVQHDPSVTGDALVALEGLADAERVLVAPNADLPSPIVATAWTHKLRCTSLDDGGEDALRAFAEDRAGRSPGTDG